MSVRVHGFALRGIEAVPCEIEVDLSGQGLPRTTLVGLPDVAVREAIDRVQTAVGNAGFDWPGGRVTINLAPADLRKEGPAFDLPMALSVLVAGGALRRSKGASEGLSRWLIAGELALDGRVRPVRGAICLAILAREAGFERVMVARENLAEAGAVEGVRAVGVETLQQALGVLAGIERGLEAVGPVPDATQVDADVDFSRVRGQAGARRALCVAAAGMHNLLMIGPAGSGKTLMARALPGLLPPMSLSERMEATRIHSCAGSLSAGSGLMTRRPVRCPHHTASAAAMVGGGSVPRPGEVSLAHGGVLFLDETPEFPRPALEALREPLETGVVTISRAARQARFPARFQLVAAMNPCPCGWLGTGSRIGRACRCTPESVARYQSRLSGPLLDRIDLQVEVLAASPEELMAAPAGEASAVVAERVGAAWHRQRQRQDEANARLAAGRIDAMCVLEEPARHFVQQAATRLAWSGRRLHRCLKVARTIADLAGAERIALVHAAEALQLQRVLPG